MLKMTIVFFLQQLDVMKSNVESRVKNYEQNLMKFEARWHQLKPKESALEEGTEGGQKAVETIREKKIEFDELEAIREALTYELISY